MRDLPLTAAALLGAAALLAVRVGAAQAPAIECARLSNLFEDGRSLAVGLQAAVKPTGSVEPEAACRSALAIDPVNSDRMFQLARALFLAGKQREAMKYYLDAADRSHAGAINDLGGIFEYGSGVPKNLATAIVWYERAAALGHAGAMNRLGELSEKGIGLPQGFATERDWYEKAATLGNGPAMNNLAELLRKDGNLPAAANWYRKAAERGLAGAMNSLGELSESGMGVAQDYRAARTWYQKAVDLGHADAMGNLGRLLESGRGGAQNLEAARELYLNGAARNGRIAMYRLGGMLENGRAVEKDLAQAKQWYQRAAELEYAPALNALGRLHLAGIGVVKDYERAKTLFEQAANLGDASAMNNLGLLYLRGAGVQRDFILARMWFEKAASLDNAQARHNLKRLDEANIVDGAQVAERRASCTQGCASLQRSYVGSVCERYFEAADIDNPERADCVNVSLRVAKQCRDSCRDWAPTLLAHNKCMPCFESSVACGAGQARSRSQGAEPYAVRASACLSDLAACMASCSRETVPVFGVSDADDDRPD
jgi:TPR repeat protein